MSCENKVEQLKKAALEAHYKNMGNVSATCAALKIGRTQFYNWKKEDEEFAKAIDEVTDFCIDHVESKLFRAINDGDLTAIIFYLKTIGKKRGYIERSEIKAAVETKEVQTFTIGGKEITF